MPTVEAFYLGTMSDLDPDEANYLTENAGNMVGLTFGTGGEVISNGTDLGDAYSIFGSAPNETPLYESIVLLDVNDGNGDGITTANDNYSVADDLTYEGSTSALDSVLSYNVTVTYTDGTTATTTMLIMQDESGRVFLSPHTEGHVDNDVLDDHPIVSIQIDSVAGDGYSGVYNDVEQDAFITCFAAGTLIATKQGLKNIARLCVGDKVCTMDHGFQPIRWIGARRVRALGAFAPIKIAAGALGQGLPVRDLRVSPQHRILVRSKIAQRIFGCSEVLLAAKKMLKIPGVSVAEDGGYVTYWHFLFDRHEIVFSEGAATESFYTGPEALNALDDAGRAEIFALFPELAQSSGLCRPARPIAQGKQQKQLMARHQKNGRLVYQG